MTNQVQISTELSDITVNTKTGEAYISQRKAAEKLGIGQSTLSEFFTRSHVSDTKQGVSSEAFELAITHYALDSKNPTQEAKELLRMVSKAGTKAYLYHEAGLTVNAMPQQRPLTQLEAFKELVRLEEERIALLETVSQQSGLLGQQSGLLVQQKEVIDYKKIITGEGEEYFPISLILNHNEDRTFSGRRLAIFSAKAEIDPIPMFASKGQIPVKAYHWSVWEAAYPNVILPE